ncbi:aldo/keto reductase [Arthrobacter sp. HMWF013]|uniref:aldo/keto reductase n=1 Tax=Arthrobacter sp. HMWF013 TaxID=2056849 RepID=UPI000D381C03|nr:aldo/keto reductase [Arthrobacter sp. HMWF013]PTT63099.1 2,5-diketo-D-gluconic acid reductase [Arthrobacter sp. HMWF013]
METVILNNGAEMPVLGFGVLQIPGDETEEAVLAALEAGYRLIDTAALYQNEEAVGRAISRSGIPRDELFITTKVWVQNAGEHNTIQSFNNSLQRLGLDYIDLYLVHQPYGDYYSQWRALQGFHEEGRARAIGVSNFHPDRLVDLITHNEITPAVNQIETHPLYQRAEDQRIMQEHGVQIMSWAPFARGKNDLFTHPVLASIAGAHGKSVAQVVLRWLNQRGVVVIPKSANPERITQNIQVFDFSLTDGEMARIARLDAGTSLFFDHRDPGMTTRLGSIRFS